MEKNIYYISLSGCLVGKCIKAQAPNERTVRNWASQNLGRMWCSIYTEELETVIGK